MTKFLNADWMVEHGFMTESECLELNTQHLTPNNDWGTDKKVKDLKLRDIATLTASSTCQDAIRLLNEENVDQIAICDG